MKWNLYLLLFLASLISFAYFWEEKELKQKFSSSPIDKKLLILDINELKQLTLKNVKLYTFKEKWMVGELNYPANKNFVDKLVKTFNGLVITKELKDVENRDDFFKFQNHAFSIRTVKDERFFRVGDISEATGEFYLEETVLGKSKLYLIKDINSYEGIFKSNKEAEYQKYVSFIGALRLKPLEFLSNKTLPKDIISEIKSIKIDDVRNDSIIIDFQEKTVQPNKFSSLKLKNPYESFSQLNSSQIIQLYELDNSKLSAFYQSILIKISGGIEVPLYLYNMYDGKKGYFISHPIYKKIIEINDIKKSLFSLNVSLFLDKRFSLLDRISQKKSLTFSLSSARGKKKKTYLVKIPNLNEFKYKSKYSLNVKSLNYLFNILLNNKSFEEADLIRVDKRFIGQTTILIDKQRYSISMKNGIIDILEHSSNTVFTFIRPDSLMRSLKLEDFIYKKPKKDSN